MPAAVPALALEQVSVTFVSPDGGRYKAVRDTTLRFIKERGTCGD